VPLSSRYWHNQQQRKPAGMQKPMVAFGALVQVRAADPPAHSASVAHFVVQRQF